MPDSVHDELFDVFDAVVRRMFVTLEAESLEALQAIELSMSQARALFALRCEAAPIAVSDVAERIRLSVATAGRTVDHLVKEGLVERWESTEDRRIKLVALTDKGQAVADVQVENKRNAVRRMLAQLDDSECRALINAMTPLLRPVQEDTP